MFRLISLILIIGAIFFVDNYFHRLVIEAKRKVANIDSKIELVRQKKEILKKEIKNLDLKINILKKEINSLKEELRFLKPYLQESLFYIDDGKFFDILEKVVKGASKFEDVTYSYSKKGLEYKVLVKGKFRKKEFLDFVKFIALVEKIKRVKRFSKVILVDKGDVEFEIEITFFTIGFIE
jgi:cell division protein FtsB